MKTRRITATVLSATRLERLAAAFRSPRLDRAVRSWNDYVKAETEGSVDL